MKKLLFSLFVWFVWIISFCSAEEIVINANNLPTELMLEGSINDYEFVFGWIDHVYWSSCNVNVKSTIGASLCKYTINSDSSTSTTCDVYSPQSDTQPPVNGPFKIQGFAWWCLNYNPDWSLTLSLPWWNTCPEINTWEILSWYILESEIDTNYCVWNWLCPNECGSWTDLSWDLQYSNIYINSILHPWEENIYIDIPDYIQWDYSISSWDFNIYVWSWYDMDYMNSIIKINSYRPDSSDFTNIFVSGLTLIFPYIFVLLLIVFIWKLIKRIFK